MFLLHNRQSEGKNVTRLSLVLNTTYMSYMYVKLNLHPRYISHFGSKALCNLKSEALRLSDFKMIYQCFGNCNFLSVIALAILQE